MNKFYLFLNILILALASGYAAVNPPEGEVSPNFSDVGVEGTLATDQIEANNSTSINIADDVSIKGELQVNTITSRNTEMAVTIDDDLVISDSLEASSLTANTIGTFKTFRRDAHSGYLQSSCPQGSFLVSCRGWSKYPRTYTVVGSLMNRSVRSSNVTCSSKLQIIPGEAALASGIKFHAHTYTCFDPRARFDTDFENITN
mgnify:CR=1 FL=1